jgi:predicted phosphodiesterase
MIVHKFPEDVPYINIYPIGDVHLGARECDVGLFKSYIDKIANDPYGYAVIVGDIMNMGLKNSKSNVYEEVLSPNEQKELCYELLEPIAHKILAGCGGNHEQRNVRETGTHPLYDVFCWLRIQDVYRENACFIKINLGKSLEHGNRQVSYGLTLTHGKTANKDLKWTYTVDGCDIFISGHTHEPDHRPLGKIVMDMQNEVVRTKGYQHIVVTPFQNYGGYTIRGKYFPNHLEQFQKITLSGTRKKVSYTFE